MGKSVDLKYTRIFNEHRKAIQETDLVIHRGGARSSKTYSIAQSLAYDWNTVIDTRLRVLIIRKTLPSVKTSVLVTFKDVVENLGLTDYMHVEKKELNFWMGKNLIHFSGLDDVEKIKSSEWNVIWMEEATDFAYDDFKQLQLRLSSPETSHFLNHIVMSFNPIDENHWIKQQLMPDEPTHQEIVSCYRDNPFLPQKYIDRIEGLIDKDPNFARIYAEGEWGILENLIYSNWDVVSEFPENLKHVFFAVDWGYNAPMAMLKLGTDNNMDFYEEEVFYEKEYTTQQLISLLPRLMGEHRKAPIYCDSANPEKIKELKDAGFNAKAAIKGKHSITNGIDFIKTRNIHIIDGSDNIRKEKQAYSWKKNKKTNQLLDEPIDYMNHLQDAERYGIITHLRRGGVRLRWLEI